MITQLNVHTFQQWQQSEQEYYLLDVREEEEVEFCVISGANHIPMNLIPLRHNELPDDVPLVIYCHHGIRSLNVARFLEQAGFEQIYNLQGGIDAWSQEIDSSVPRY